MALAVPAANPGVLVPARPDRRKEHLWCLGRKGDCYEELLLLTRVGATTSLDSEDVERLFRGQLDVSLTSRVRQRGRRNFAVLPREDASMIARAQAARVNAASCWWFSFTRSQRMLVYLWREFEPLPGIWGFDYWWLSCGRCGPRISEHLPVELGCCYLLAFGKER